MKILLDTHMLLWALSDNKKLPKKAAEIIDDPENSLFYSVISVWETAIKHMRHPDKLNVSSAELVNYCLKSKIKSLSLSTAHIYTLETLSRPEDAPPHNDPFDRILIAQAKSENMLFLTHDDTLSYYNEPCIICV